MLAPPLRIRQVRWRLYSGEQLGEEGLELWDSIVGRILNLGDEVSVFPLLTGVLLINVCLL